MMLFCRNSALHPLVFLLSLILIQPEIVFAQQVPSWCLDIPPQGSKKALESEKRKLFTKLSSELHKMQPFVDSPEERRNLDALKRRSEKISSQTTQAITTLPRDFMLCLFPAPAGQCQQLPILDHALLGPSVREFPNLLADAVRIVAPSPGKGFAQGEKGSEQRRLYSRLRDLQNQSRLIPPLVFVCS